MGVRASELHGGPLDVSGSLACHLAEDSPVPTRIRAPGWRSIGIRERVEQEVGTAVAIVCGVTLIRGSGPCVMAAGGGSCYSSDQRPGAAVDVLQRASRILRAG